MRMAFRSRRFRAVIGVVAIGLVGAGLLTFVVEDREQPLVEGSTDGGAEQAATRDPLPVGGIQVSWELPTSEFYAYAMDHTTHSIALKDFAIGPNETARIEIIDAERGFVRWRRELDASWLVNADGTLTATTDGIGFIIGTSFTNPLPLSAVRLADGHPVWHAPPGMGWGPRMVGDVIVLHTDTVVSAIDARSGSQRWQWRSSDACGPGLDVDDGADATLVVKCGRTVHGVAVSDGSASWKWETSSDGCLVHDTAASKRFVGVMVTCEPAEQRLHVLDSTTGVEKWKHAVPWNPDAADPADPSKGAARVSVAASGAEAILEIDSNGGVERFAASTGASVPSDRGHGSSIAVAAVAGNLIYRHEVNPYRDYEDISTVSAVDPQSGSTVWTRPLPLTSVDHAGDAFPVQHVAGDTLYLIGSVKGLWPAVIVLVDALTGDMTASATGWDDGELVGVAPNGMVYAAFRPHDHDESRLVAFRVTGHAPGYLGTTVRADDWPDACRLLSGAQYRSALGVVPAVKPVALSAPGAALPVPPQCRHLPPSIDGTEVTVEVSWLADNADAAIAAAARQSPLGRDGTTVSLGTARYQAWQWNETNTGVDLVPRTRLSFAVGRCVASVTTLGPKDAVVTIGGIVADNLANPAVSPGCAAQRG
jgi:hypothetical protein